jgi:hypothetical protein
VNLQIARHNAGARKTGGISEASNENQNDYYDEEMVDPGIRTRPDYFPGRLREEGRSAAPAATTAANRSHGLAVGQPEYH